MNNISPKMNNIWFKTWRIVHRKSLMCGVGTLFSTVYHFNMWYDDGHYIWKRLYTNGSRHAKILCAKKKFVKMLKCQRRWGRKKQCFSPYLAASDDFPSLFAKLNYIAIEMDLWNDSIDTRIYNCSVIFGSNTTMLLFKTRKWLMRFGSIRNTIFCSSFFLTCFFFLFVTKSLY